MSSPTPPPPLPDPDDELRPRPPRRRSAPSPRRRGSPRSQRSLRSRLSPRMWAVVIAVVAIVLVLVVGALAGGSDKKKKAAIKTESAASALQALLDGVDKGTTLGSCPFGSVSAIAVDVQGDVKLADELADALHEIVIGGKDSVNEVLCSATTADDRVHLSRTMYVYATPAPKGSYTDYLTKTLLSGAQVRLEDPLKFDGGTIYTFCTTPDADIKGGCGADWVAGDNKLVLGMQVASDTVTAKQVTSALEHELETLANRLGGGQPTASSVPGTGGSVVVGSAAVTGSQRPTTGTSVRATARGSTTSTQPPTFSTGT